MPVALAVGVRKIAGGRLGLECLPPSPGLGASGHRVSGEVRLTPAWIFRMKLPARHKSEMSAVPSPGSRARAQAGH